MRALDIRMRILLAALLPVTLVAVLLSVVFMLARAADNAQAHGERTRSLVRQVASASEYGLFSGNRSSLQAIATGVLRDKAVRSVRIMDAQGLVLAGAGVPQHTMQALAAGQEGERLDLAGNIDLLWQPIAPTQIKLDDLFEEEPSRAASPPAPLGQVVMEVSRESLVQRNREMLAVGLAVSLLGLLFGGFLAVRLGKGVMQPIARVQRMVARIGAGDFSARTPFRHNDSLRDLQRGLNEMADRIESGRDELEQRIRAATAELREKKEEAEIATLAKTRFLSAASHDLRQPTHALGMFVARLAHLTQPPQVALGPGQAEISHLVVNLDAAVRAMQDLLDGLLDMSRLDAGAVPVNVRAMSVDALFDALRDSLGAVAQGKGLRLRVRPSPLWVLSDPVLLQRILLNLLGNALRYTQTGTVLLTCRPSGAGERVRIEVWDSGIGMAPEHQQAVFREFYQVGNTERDRAKGLGLGLNIVQRTARLLGHPLTLRSAAGRGTRFSLELPLALAEPASAAVPVADAVAALTGFDGLRVLVVEDDAMVSQSLADLLQAWGCEVRVAAGRQEALACLALHGGDFFPDVIVSDYRLREGEDGIEVIAALRHASMHKVAACLMSGDTDEGLMALARETELTLLHKPVRPAKLRSLMRHLGRRRG